MGQCCLSDVCLAADPAGFVQYVYCADCLWFKVCVCAALVGGDWNLFGDSNESHVSG